jgi:glycosyltransferase involved in cell wall biosynthesis
MDIYVLSSVNEGISNSLLEAMATGLPVIATTVGGNPEVVADGDSGLLFPARSPHTLAWRIAELRQDPELRLKLARHALERVRREFSLDSMVRKYEELYRSLRPATVTRVPASVGA